ncbi:MAG: hypothetical protein K2K65_00350 [Duncaniella sp.]|nr:hypothetical protein [Duncaniella sp.]
MKLRGMNMAYMRWLLLVILVVITAGCNKDIFIDGEVVPADTEATVSVGETATFRFPTDGLIEVRADFYDKYDCVKYLASGEVFASYTDVVTMSLFDITSSQPFIPRLTAESDNVSFEITGSPSGEISLTSLTNSLGEDALCLVTIRYRYGREFCIMFVMPSTEEPPMFKVKEMLYESNLRFTSGERHYEQLVLLNATQTPTEYSYSVSELCRTGVHFQLDTDGAVIKGLDTDGYCAPIPTVSGAERKVGFYGATVPFSIGSQYLPPDDSSLFEGESFYKVYNVSVPAMTGVYADVNCVEGVIDTYATLVTENMTTGKERIFTVRVTVLQTVKYGVEFKEKAYQLN